MPVTLLLLGGGLAKAIKDYYVQGSIGNLSSMVLLASLQVYMMGLLGTLIVHGRLLRAPHSLVREQAGKSRASTDESVQAFPSSKVVNG